MNRRHLLKNIAPTLAGGAAIAGLLPGRLVQASAAGTTRHSPYTPVVMPNGWTLPSRWEDGCRTFHLVAGPLQHEVAPGMTINAWGYNGSTPGPVIEAVEGERVRIYVTNNLKEHTSVHWHGLILPAGMDGVGGLTQPQIRPGETYRYEFTLRQHGTFMYHPHADEMVQIALGMMGFFIVHPRTVRTPKVDRDFCIMLMEWHVEPGTSTPDPSVMTDFNLFTFNSRAFPGTQPLIVRRGDRVRLRVANLSMNSHPVHFHGHPITVTATDGGQIPRTAWWPETTVNVPVGSTRDIEFTADYPGDWILHCHKSHHTMNPMGHGNPNTLGVDQRGVEEKVEKLIPGYMAMGEHGMAEMSEMQMQLPGNTLPMMAGIGPFGPIEMGGMFTVVKVRENLKNYDADPGWYDYPKGTRAEKASPPAVPPVMRDNSSR